MKTKKSLIGITVVCMSFAIFFACKKQESLEAPLIANNTEIKNAVKMLQESFQQTASEWSKQKLSSVVSTLDYATSAAIALNDGGTMYLAKLTTGGKAKTDRFLAVLKNKDGYSFDGVYEAKGLPVIVSLLKSHVLPANDSVYVRGLNSMPTKEWKVINGNVTELIVKNISPKKLRETLLRLSSLNSKVKVNLVDDGGGGSGSECTEYWFWIYETELGEWIPLYYLYTICGDSGGGGGGGGETSCLEEAQGYSDNLAGTQVSIDDEELVTNLGDTAVIDRKWTVVDCLTFSYHSKEIGVTEKPDPNYDVWQWKSLTHHSINRIGLPLGGSSNLNAGSVTSHPNITSNRLYASMKLDFTVTYTPADFDCGAVRIHLPSYDLGYNPESPQWLAKGH